MIERASGFTRRQVLDRLRRFACCAAAGEDVLVALDFPFSFPFAAKNNRFIDGSTSWWDFSQSIHAALDPNGQACNLYGGPHQYGQGGYADHFAHLFRGANNVGPHYVEEYRETEYNAQALGCPAASVFRLILPMVGVQSLAGIFLIQSLLNWCVARRMPLTVWPLGHLDRGGQWSPGAFDWADPGLILVESYPRLSYRRAGVPNRQLNSQQAVQQAIAQLGSLANSQAVQVTPQTPDEQDALIVLLHLLSPAWYRAQVEPTMPPTASHLYGIHEVPLPPPNLTGPDVQPPLLAIEGNIFGV
jgi:hypothetical protein